MKKYIEIVRYEEDEVIHRIDVTDKTERQIEKVDLGININLEHERFYTRIKEN